MKVKLKRKHIQTILDALAFVVYSFTEDVHKCDNPECTLEKDRALILAELAEANTMLQDIEGVDAPMKAILVSVPPGTILN